MDPWTALIGALLATRNLIRGARFNQEALTDQALAAECSAASETKTYLSGLQRGNQRDLEKEGVLSRLWSLAAIPLRHFNNELARRCELKGAYWRNPQDWTVADINAARIGLTQVEKEAKYLLYLKIPPRQ
jgi:hypothetical protein